MKICVISTAAKASFSTAFCLHSASQALEAGHQVLALVPPAHAAEFKEFEKLGLVVRICHESGTNPDANRRKGRPEEYPYDAVTEFHPDMIWLDQGQLSDLLPQHLLLIALLQNIGIDYVPVLQSEAAGTDFSEEMRALLRLYLSSAYKLVFTSSAAQHWYATELKTTFSNAAVPGNPLLEPVPLPSLPQPEAEHSSAPVRNGRPSPKVSVIIPCYNYGRYLRACLSSVVTQSFQDFEIIIVNDGSTDDSREVAEAFIAENPAVDIKLINQKNSGQPAIPRNNGIGQSRGKYIICLDADDMMDQRMLEKFVDVLDRENDVHVVYSEAIFFDDAGKCHYETVGDFELEKLAVVNQVFYCSMYRREVWDIAGGYKLNVRGYEDWDFWISCAEAGLRGKRIYEPLLLYRVSASGLFGQANERADYLKANIVKNHQQVYDAATNRWADEFLQVWNSRTQN